MFVYNVSLWVSEFIILGVQRASLMFILMSFTKTGKFSAIISSRFLSAPCFLSSPSGMYVAYVDSLHGVPKVL